jgi:hypothetical protein
MNKIKKALVQKAVDKMLTEDEDFPLNIPVYDNSTDELSHKLDIIIHTLKEMKWEIDDIKREQRKFDSITELKEKFGRQESK